MVNSRDSNDGDAADDPSAGPTEGDPIVSCEFQDGHLSVYQDRVVIERASASKFDDREVPFDRVRGATYAGRLVIGYLQIETGDVDADAATLLSTPVDENTLHFGRGKRECAKRARDAILERASAN